MLLIFSTILSQRAHLAQYPFYTFIQYHKAGFKCLSSILWVFISIQQLHLINSNQQYSGLCFYVPANIRHIVDDMSKFWIFPCFCLGIESTFNSYLLWAEGCCHLLYNSLTDVYQSNDNGIHCKMFFRSLLLRFITLCIHCILPVWF